MQVDEKRACPACSAENPGESRFCWRCYAPFAVEEATPPAPQPGNGASPMGGRPGMARPGPGLPPAPISAPPATPAPSRSSSLVLRIVVGVIAAAAGYFLVGRFLGTSYEAPVAIAGVARMAGADAEAFEAEMESLGEDYDITVDAGIYGTRETPSMALIVMSGKAIEGTDELFGAFVDGLASTGAEVGRGDERTGDLDGVEYRCVPVRGQGVSAAVCMWRADDHMGMLLDLTHGVDDVRPTLRAAFDAVRA